jgi:pSer/pThr/pTyr-binding forkhead associated (FHA) protein
MHAVPISPRAATAAELKAHIEAERASNPFVVFRDGGGTHTIFFLDSDRERVTIGRSPSTDLAFIWDDEVSRVHAELARIGEVWALVDDGLSLNGSYVNGAIVHGRRRLHDGDTVRVGRTLVLFRDPDEADARTTVPIDKLEEAVALSETQRKVLVALCRPFKSATAFVTPAPNDQIAAEVFLSVDAVKKHMRALYEKFGVEELPQYEKRARLVERAFAGGFVTERDL